MNSDRSGRLGASPQPYKTDRRLARFFFSRKPLLANAERLDDGPVTIDVLRFQIVQQSSPLADQHQQAPARMVIFKRGLEVLGQVRDPAQKSSAI